MEHLVKHNGIFYVPIAVIHDADRGWIKSSWLSKCAKSNKVPSFKGSDIGVNATKRGDTGKPVRGRAGKYYILDDALNLLPQDKVPEAPLVPQQLAAI